MPALAKRIWSMIIINLAILISTLTIHELGHALTGKLLGCVTARAVIFDSNSPNPYTELVCQKEEKTTYLAGLALTTLFGLSFLAFEDKQRPLSLVIIGFGIFLAALDVVEFTRLNFMQYLFMLSGLVSLIIGQILYGIYNVKD
jgi:hypothetical protein